MNKESQAWTNDEYDWSVFLHLMSICLHISCYNNVSEKQTLGARNWLHYNFWFMTHYLVRKCAQRRREACGETREHLDCRYQQFVRTIWEFEFGQGNSLLTSQLSEGPRGIHFCPGRGPPHLDHLSANSGNQLFGWLPSILSAPRMKKCTSWNLDFIPSPLLAWNNSVLNLLVVWCISLVGLLREIILYICESIAVCTVNHWQRRKSSLSITFAASPKQKQSNLQVRVHVRAAALFCHVRSWHMEKGRLKCSPSVALPLNVAAQDRTFVSSDFINPHF